MLLQIDNILSVELNNKLVVCIFCVWRFLNLIFNNLFSFYLIKVLAHNGL